MGLLDVFSRKHSQDTEIRAREDFRYGSFSITSFFGDGGLITEEQAMKIPSVASSVELITSSIAQLPVYLYKQDKNGEVKKVEDRRVFLLNSEPNELLNGHNLKKQIVKDYLFHGASYVKAEKYRNDTISLYYLPIKDIVITKYKRDGYRYSAEVGLLYDSDDKMRTEKSQFPLDELVIVLRDSEDGVTSTGVLKNNSELFRLALDEIDYTSGILKNGALPIGLIKVPTRLTEVALTRLRSSFDALYRGAKNSGKTLILEEGLDYQSVSLKPNEMDLSNQKKNTISEIARVFNVPESMINSSANKYASNEQNNIYFLQYCIAPIVTSIETSLDRTLLLESEKEEGYYFRFDTSEILRTTEKEKVDAVVRGMEKGLFSINEARAKVDLPRIKDDYFTWNLGSVFYDPKTGNMTIPNMGMTIDPENLQQPITPTEDESEQVDDSSEEDNQDSQEV